jgi:hypothetical protein
MSHVQTRPATKVIMPVPHYRPTVWTRRVKLIVSGSLSSLHVK